MVEQIVRRRMDVPDGNCRHGPESGGVVNQENISIRNDHVVSELVLHYDVNHYLRMHFITRFTRSPDKNLIKARVFGYLR
jgi:hypothetical protein